MKSKTTIPIRNLFRILVHAWEDLDLADPSELDLDGIDISSGELNFAIKKTEEVRRWGCGWGGGLLFGSHFGRKSLKTKKSK